MAERAKMGHLWKYVLLGFYGQTYETEENSSGSDGDLDIPSPSQNQIPAPQNAQQPEIVNQLPAEIRQNTDGRNEYLQRLGTEMKDIANSYSKEKRRRIIRIQEIGLELRLLADSFLCPEPNASLLALREGILRNGELSEAEVEVIRLINSYLGESEPPSFILYQIGEHLRNCLTSRTFRLALEFICYNSSSVPEEIAAACDLATVVYPRFQDLVTANSIYNELGEFIEKCVDDHSH